MEGRKDQEEKRGDKKHYELNRERKIAKVKEKRDRKKVPYVTLMYMCMVLQVQMLQICNEFAWLVHVGILDGLKKKEFKGEY